MENLIILSIDEASVWKVMVETEIYSSHNINYKDHDWWVNIVNELVLYSCNRTIREIMDKFPGFTIIICYRGDIAIHEPDERSKRKRIIENLKGKE